MIIVNKECNDAYNVAHVTNIYIGSDGCTIKASAGSATRGGILGKYETFEETKIAFLMLIDGIAKSSNLFRMPSDTDVKAKIKSVPSKTYHHITGKKTKGHGAS